MKHILALRQDNNGDVTLQGPALRALATGGRVTLVCGPSGEGAARLLPAVTDVRVVRADWIEGTPRAIDPAAIRRDVALYAELAADEAFIFTSFHQSPLPSALLLRLAGVPAIAAIAVDYPGSLVDTRVRVRDDIHEVERSLALVAAGGYALPPGDDGGLRYRELGAPGVALPEQYVAVQPGASVPARAWSPARLRELVARLERDGRRVVILGSASEAALGQTVAGDSGALDLCGVTTFAQFAAIVRDARALVVGNTSGIHVAAAVGTPVVSIFPPTIPPLRFAPWQVPNVLLGDHTIECAGCRARVCPIQGQPCTGGVTVDDVIAALQQLALDETRRRKNPLEVVA